MEIDYDSFKNQGQLLVDRGNKRPDDLLAALDKAATVSNLRIRIQFQCGDCCKIVEGGKDLNVIGNYAVLSSNSNDLCLKVISNCRTITRRRIASIVIPLDRICSFEFESNC